MYKISKLYIHGYLKKTASKAETNLYFQKTGKHFYKYNFCHPFFFQKLNESSFLIDYHIENLLVFSPNAQFLDNLLLKKNHVSLHDKVCNLVI